jgi:cysteine-rich repeat protein
MTKHLPSILVQFALFVGAALALTCTEPGSVECPNGLICPTGTVCAAAQDVCIANGCGDSEVAGNEVCDDGNIRDGDGCSGDCESVEDCGNDIVDTAAGEVCDDGNEVSGDGCSEDCRSSELCGNEIVDTAAGEVFDVCNTVC